MKQKLEHQVAAAVGGILAGMDEASLDEVTAQLPAHIKAANPSMKSVTRAIVSAGWSGHARAGGKVVYLPADAELSGSDSQHNACEGGSVAADEMRLLIERAERLEEEKKGIADDIKDVWSEAKGRGYDVSALKTIMKVRGTKKEDHQAKQAVLEVYMNSLGMLA